MKTAEELNTLKEEVETVNRKLHELTDEELAQVTGGCIIGTGGFPLAPQREKHGVNVNGLDSFSVIQEREGRLGFIG